MDQPVAALPWPLSAYLIPVAVGITIAAMTGMASLLCWFVREILGQINRLNERQLAMLQEENKHNREERERDETRWLATLDEVVKVMGHQTESLKDMNRTIATAAQVTETLVSSVRELREDSRRAARP